MCIQRCQCESAFYWPKQLVFFRHLTHYFPSKTVHVILIGCIFRRVKVESDYMRLTSLRFRTYVHEPVFTFVDSITKNNSDIIAFFDNLPLIKGNSKRTTNVLKNLFPIAQCSKSRAANSVDFYIEFKFEFQFSLLYEFNIFIFASCSSSRHVKIYQVFSSS